MRAARSVIISVSFVFLSPLLQYDKDNIAVKAMKQIRETYIPNEEFEPSKVAKASSAASGLCSWVRAMEAYDRVAKVSPPRLRGRGSLTRLLPLFRLWSRRRRS